MPKLLLCLVALLALTAACADIPADAADQPDATSATGAASPTPARSTTPAPSTAATPPAAPKVVPLARLPRGGRRLFPTYQLVGFVGAPGAPALGPLDSNLDERAQRLEKLAASYRGGRLVQPVMELIVTTAQGAPGADGKYRSRIAPAQIDRYLAVARKHRMLLMLDIQPGRAKPLDEVRRLAKWLRQPDVGLALDPEWEVGPGQVPGRVFGRTTGAELNSVAAYLAALVSSYRLPEKLFVFHQLTKPIVRDDTVLRAYPGVATVRSVDGIGTKAQKLATYRGLTKVLPKGIHTGFKLFYEEDTRHGPLMTPPQVLAVRPRPELVIYE